MGNFVATIWRGLLSIPKWFHKYPGGHGALPFRGWGWARKDVFFQARLKAPFKLAAEDVAVFIAHGLAEIIALDLFTAYGLQEIDLFLRFCPFGQGMVSRKAKPSSIGFSKCREIESIPS